MANGVPAKINKTTSVSLTILIPLIGAIVGSVVFVMVTRSGVNNTKDKIESHVSDPQLHHNFASKAEQTFATQKEIEFIREDIYRVEMKLDELLDISRRQLNKK